MKKRKIIVMVLLSIVTLGIYPAVWYIKTKKDINTLDAEIKMYFSGPVLLLILSIASVLFEVYDFFVSFYIYDAQYRKINTPDIITASNIIQGLRIFEDVLAWIIVFFIVMLAFRTRSILNRYIEQNNIRTRISGFWTLIFNFFYIQYKINKIEFQKK